MNVNIAEEITRQDDFVFTNDISMATERKLHNYVLHIFVQSGSFSFRIGANGFSATAPSVIIIPSGDIPWNIRPSADFKIVGLFISDHYMQLHMPKIDYHTTCMLSFLENPVLPITSEELSFCLSVVKTLKYRYEQTGHTFYHEVLADSVHQLVYDIMNLHSQKRERKLSNAPQSMRLFRNFIHLLEERNFMTNREVSYYANILCITPKYLSEVCLKASGHPASYWIDRFTTEEISRQLADESLSVADICENLNFKSLSYFSRYVKQRLQLPPIQIRKQMNPNGGIPSASEE